MALKRLKSAETLSSVAGGGDAQSALRHRRYALKGALRTPVYKITAASHRGEAPLSSNQKTIILQKEYFFPVRARRHSIIVRVILRSCVTANPRPSLGWQGRAFRPRKRENVNRRVIHIAAPSGKTPSVPCTASVVMGARAPAQSYDPKVV